MDKMGETLIQGKEFPDDVFFHRAGKNNYVSLGSDEGVAVAYRIWRVLLIAMNVSERVINPSKMYRSSIALDLLDNANCHKSALFLEGLVRAKELKADANADPAESGKNDGYGGYPEVRRILKEEVNIEYKTVEELQKAVVCKEVATPCVVHIVNTDVRDITRNDRTPHSMVILGTDPHGRVVCAEKESYGGDFRILPLKEFQRPWEGFSFVVNVDSTDRLESHS